MRSREAVFAPSAGRHYLGYMTDKPKRPRDANQLAKFIVDVATGDHVVNDAPAPQSIGGKVGGARRAQVLSPDQRSEIARVAAAARWKKDH